MNNSSALALQMDKIRAFFTDLIRRVEESPYFERAVVKFENLDVRQQKTLRILALVLAILIPLTILVLPLASVISSRALLSSTRSLVGEMQRFNDEQSVVHQPAPRPLGWQALAASSPEEAESSLQQYLAGIGVSGDLLEMSRSGETIKISIKELSIKQAVAFIHQLDGWFPALHPQNLKIGVNSADKQLLVLDVSLRHDAAGAQRLGRAPAPRGRSSGFSGSGSSFGGSGTSAAPSGGDSDFGGGELDSPSASGGSQGSFDSAPMDDFGDLPPPPPFEEDL
jgi:hypothetical protein